MFDQDCECGGEDCRCNFTVRKAPMYLDDGTETESFLHVDTTDLKGMYVEVILTQKTARELTWWLIKNFFLHPRKKAIADRFKGKRTE